MQTHAQIDTYRQEHYEYLRQQVEKRKLEDIDQVDSMSYEEVSKLLQEQDKSSFTKDLASWINPISIYNNVNSWIETTARIASYLFDRYMNGYTFNETVNNSLKHWFNYGQRSPLEMQLLADIPYLSFPIRSIDNWIDRLLDPKFIRLMSDIIDGVYEQYSDENGQYDEFTQYQIMNGWLPIGKGVGLQNGFWCI